MGHREKPIQQAIRLALHEAGVLCWAHSIDNRNTSTGLGVGTADLICVVPPHGRICAIEVKVRASYSKTTETQERWLAQVRLHGGIAGVARDVDEAMALVELARKKEST